MILHSMKLLDVGAYAGEQTIAFSQDARRPVTLVGGLNGAGKTTLIRSLFHTLYGARALSVIGRRVAYGVFLDDSVHSGAKRSLLELELEIPAIRSDSRIVVRRSWERPSRGKDQLDVFVDGAYDEELSESWAETIEQAAPLGIARLFFFDGEKIEALADLDEAAETLRTALGSLLGLDLVDQLSIDLGAVQRRVMREAKDGPSTDELDRREARLEAQSQVESDARRRVEELEQRLADANTDHDKISNALRAAGGDLIADREFLDTERSEAAASEVVVWDQLRAIAANPSTPLTLISKLLGDVLDTAAKSGSVATAESIRTMLEARDEWIATLLRDAGVEAAAVIAELERDRRERTAIAGAPAAFAPVSAHPAIARLLEEDLPARRGEALRVLDALDQASATVDDLDRRIARIPSNDSVRLLLNARDESAERVEQAQNDLSEARQLVGVSEGQTKRARELRDSELARLASAEDHVDRDRRITDHAERAKATLEHFRRVVTQRHVERIASYAMESLRALLRKDGLVTDMSIDPGTFELRLVGANGAELKSEALSAGERQLTALALLWGLARSAGRPLPVVIDTPLGRLDAGHRRHVVERYLPSASHQVVVLSTDTEIDAGMHELLEDQVGCEYRLAQTPAGATSIVPGYFDLVPA